jgi:molybdopterin converting factor small subunit
MFPNPQTITVEKPATLHEFIKSLGPEIRYAYEQRVIIVLVNGEGGWPSKPLKAGDHVYIFPIISGG